jgi:hypothetical protein
LDVTPIQQTEGDDQLSATAHQLVQQLNQLTSPPPKPPKSPKFPRKPKTPLKNVTTPKKEDRSHVILEDLEEKFPDLNIPKVIWQKPLKQWTRIKLKEHNAQQNGRNKIAKIQNIKKQKETLYNSLIKDVNAATRRVQNVLIIIF